MKRITFILLFLTCLGCFAQASFNKFDPAAFSTGDLAYNDYNYSTAITEYESEISSGKKSEAILKRLGDSYYFNAKLPEANKWYKKLMDSDIEVEPEYLFRYSQTLKSVGDYDRANKYLEKFHEADSKDLRAVMFKDNPDYLDDIDSRSKHYEISHLPCNTKYSDFAPSLNGGKLVFSSSFNRDPYSKFVHKSNNRPFIDLYEVDVNGMDEPKKLKGKLNTTFHESSAVFTANGNTVYFTRSCKESRGSKNIKRLNILKAIKSGDKWKNVKRLPFNDDRYVYAHPTLSPNEDRLYFASDMPGTKGASDIYVVDILADGSYGEPKNLGLGINTEGRETFPFVSKDNKLYFASDGHLGLGGLDVFMVMLDDDGQVQGDVINLGAPINSNRDDFSFTIDDATNSGYFASNRKGGKGEDDIYGFSAAKPVPGNIGLIVKGKVIDNKTKNALIGAKVLLLDTDNNIIDEIWSGPLGEFSFTLDGTRGHLIRADLGDYLISETFVGKTDRSAYTEVVVALNHDEVVSEEGDDLGKMLKINPIYFGFDQAKIRTGDSEEELNKIVEAMNLYPTIKIEVRSHTDSRGDDDYNMALSERRARATVGYIVKKGISPDRISGKGFGEIQPINTFGNSAAHDLNRRSEFIMITNTKNIGYRNLGQGTIAALEPDEPYFTVQLGLFKKELGKGFFKGIKHHKVYKAEKGATAYCSGKFATKELAVKHREMIVEKGITNAFITRIEENKSSIACN